MGNEQEQQRQQEKRRNDRDADEANRCTVLNCPIQRNEVMVPKGIDPEEQRGIATPGQHDGVDNDGFGKLRELQKVRDDGEEGDKGEKEEIQPEKDAIYTLNNIHQSSMIHPVGGQDSKRDCVKERTIKKIAGKRFFEILVVCHCVWNADIDDEQRDRNRKDAIAEHSYSILTGFLQRFQSGRSSGLVGSCLIPVFRYFHITLLQT